MNTTLVPGNAATPDSRIATARPRARYRHLTWRVVLHVVLYGGAVIFLIPLFWMLSTGLKTLQETYAYPPTLWPSVAQWQNFNPCLRPFRRLSQSRRVR